MDEYTISPLEKTQFQAVEDFLLGDYIPRERCCVTSGLSLEIGSHQDLLHSDLQEMMEAGLSFVAVNTQDLTVAGVAINVPLEVENYTEEYLSQLPKSLQAITAYLNTLKSKMDLKEFQLSPAHGLYLKMLGVGRNHGGKGLARKLTEKTLELAQQKGFTYVESLATAPATHHLFESMGFDNKSEMKFQDYLMEDGTPAFPHATPQDFGRLTIKTISSPAE